MNDRSWSETAVFGASKKRPDLEILCWTLRKGVENYDIQHSSNPALDIETPVRRADMANQTSRTKWNAKKCEIRSGWKRVEANKTHLFWRRT